MIEDRRCLKQSLSRIVFRNSSGVNLFTFLLIFLTINE